jgi:hypothetical protein
VYERHDVGTDTLHQVVRENLQTFLSAIEAGFAGGKLPSFVEAELTGRAATLAAEAAAQGRAGCAGYLPTRA